ncbi:hypothetical protein ABN09_00350 [Morganella morganii]|nr:hypothetical protein ABN09_00350 [Morganella morganii]
MPALPHWGPLLDKLGNGGKGISWNTQEEVDFLKNLNRTRTEGAAEGRPAIETAIDAAEVVLSLATGNQRPCGGESLGCAR